MRQPMLWPTSTVSTAPAGGESSLQRSLISRANAETVGSERMEAGVWPWPGRSGAIKRAGGVWRGEVRVVRRGL